MNNTIIIDNQEIQLAGERNIVEVARKAGIDIPTFCYHSELSIYGACRMCLVEIQGIGIVASCSTPPVPNMKVKTNTPEIRDIRKTNLELMLAAHDRECTTCSKSGACTLQRLSRTMGVDAIRFKPAPRAAGLDTSSAALVRNPNKCVLCGDCARFCDEIQSVGAIDFAYRGAQAMVMPAFGKDLADVDCVNCGQCARVCPTGAIVVRSEIEAVWRDLANPQKTVVAQIAPAIRVALGEYFNLPVGAITTGKIAMALQRLGFDKVYDTSFTADLTVLEEGTEFLHRVQGDGALPQFTSCCPAWVTFAEQYFADLRGNLSTCKSPQQMFGSLAKETLPQRFQIARDDLVVVSIMPCTAKKFEAKRPEFRDQNGRQDIDHVLTTQELGQMIESAGIRFADLPEAEMDLPLGFASGAGVLFGASGGVTEAVLRYAYQKVEGQPFTGTLANAAEPEKGIREVTVTMGGKTFKMAVVYGLANARKIAEQVRNKTCPYDLIEVMACPGGCINGAGQPVTYDFETIKRRGQSLYAVDQSLKVRTAQDNPYIVEAYAKFLGEIGGRKAHELLHTTYYHRRRINSQGIDLSEQAAKPAVTVEICVGTNCCLHGAHDLLKEAMTYVYERQLQEQVQVKAAFCFEKCAESPVVKIGEEIIGRCTFEVIRAQIEAVVKTAPVVMPGKTAPEQRIGL